MPTNYTSRFILIGVILFAALISIFPGSFKGDFRPDLKPGIDMVGGTSLLYEIKQPEGGGPATGKLAEDVATALKKRVDPDGVRNLIWRPQGNSRLEIQMPANPKATGATDRRKAFAAAQAKLEETNVRSSDVIRAVETMTGDGRRDKLKQLAMGSTTRDKLFGAMASVWDQIEKAKTEKNAAVQAEKEIEYDNLKKQIDDTNLTAAVLESSIASADGQKKVDDLKKRYADFPARLSAIDNFAKAYSDFKKASGELEDAADLKRLLRGSGVLEFHILVDYDPVRPAPQVAEMIDRLHKRGPVQQAGDTMRWYLVDKPEEFKSRSEQYNGNYYVLAYTTPDKALVNRPGLPQWALAGAQPQMDQNSGERIVGFRFDATGGRLFGDLTRANTHLPLGIVLDDRMISAPNINEPITTGSGMISGNKNEGGFSAKEQGYLVSMLSAGSLPARLTDEPISEHTVGPQLGQDNLRAGLMSCIIGGILVVVFMIGYYYLSGVVACVALICNIVLILGVMAALNATFTLPGVAAVVLTIGMAVDANVLVYERLREEMDRGLSVRMALRNAYDRAFSAILDGNLTTAITSGALYCFGSEEVKGFGLTLMIGIACSLFTALFVTKTIFAVLLDKFHVPKLGSIPQSFPRWQKMLHPNWDWMGIWGYFYTFSGVFILGGLICIFVTAHKGQLFDIEFASGTSVQFDLKQPMPIEKVREIITKMSEQRPNDLPAPSVVSASTDNLSYEVITPQKDAPPVKRAIIDAMGDRLKVELPSTFTGTGKTLEEVKNDLVVPLDDVDKSRAQLPDVPANDISNHIGGAAIKLTNITPPLSPAEIKDRIDRYRLQPQPGQATIPYRDFTVVADTPPNQPTSSAVVLVSDPSLPHDQDEIKWQEDLVRPMWRLANEAINSQVQLQKVTNFDAQVAGETQRMAFLALAASIVGIMAYIWVRFGNLKYGTATVVALLHDVLFTVAALGYSAYLIELPVVGHFFRDVLLVEPFRVNLTIIAAVLTVMGYSMNDTVVVFDRIRENRGKFGSASRRVINDSINQTLSRTLLTSGCTLVTCATMYFLGGPGIHGFTYCLVLGILVGTYSSVAIAAPILLLGEEPSDAGTGGDSKAKEEARKQATPVGQLQRA